MIVSRWFTDYGLDALTERLLVGSLPTDADDVAILAGRGVARVVNLVDDSEYEGDAHAAVAETYRAHGIAEARVPSADYGHLSVEHLERVTALTTSAIADGATVYVHCRAGWQRSVIAAAATLALTERRPALDALRAVMAGRRGADPLPHQIADLLRWWSAKAA